MGGDRTAEDDRRDGDDREDRAGRNDDGGRDDRDGGGGREDGVPDEGDDEPDAGGRPCPRCDRPMYRRHCKYVCPSHGVVFDCADTFY